MEQKRYVVFENEFESGGGKMLKFFKDKTKALNYTDSLNREKWRGNLAWSNINGLVDWDTVKAELEKHQIHLHPELPDEELNHIFRKIEELSRQDYYPFGLLLNYRLLEVTEQ